jgi:hypothetical protein
MYACVLVSFVGACSMVKDMSGYGILIGFERTTEYQPMIDATAIGDRREAQA